MKSKIVHVRFKEQDYINIKKTAESRNKNLSEYIRQVVCDTIQINDIPIEKKYPWLLKIKKRTKL